VLLLLLLLHLKVKLKNLSLFKKICRSMDDPIGKRKTWETICKYLMMKEEMKCGVDFGQPCIS